MVKPTILILTFLTAMTCFGSTLIAPGAIKGFQEWKTEKVQAAANQISLVRNQIFKAQNEGNKKTVENLEKQVTQLKWNMEVAQDLSVTDYFVLYLSQQTQNDRFTQAAVRLSTKEIAELMEAYANTLRSAPTEVLVRHGNPSVFPGKIPVQAIQHRDSNK